MEVEKIKSWVSLIFYSILIISLVIFTFNYAFVDWEAVSEGMEKLTDTMKCEIDYKDFHYSGLCLDRNDIFNFINNTSWS